MKGTKGEGFKERQNEWLKSRLWPILRRVKVTIRRLGISKSLNCLNQVPEEVTVVYRYIIII